MMHDLLSALASLFQIIFSAILRAKFLLDCLPPQTDFHAKRPMIRQPSDPLSHVELGRFIVGEKALLLAGSLVGVLIRLLYVFGLVSEFVELNPFIMAVEIPFFQNLDVQIDILLLREGQIHGKLQDRKLHLFQRREYLAHPAVRLQP